MSIYRRFLLPVYVLLSVVVYYYSAGYADNPDTFQYLSIARKYAEGQFPVNGYWSPLISWLLVLPLKFTANGVLAFKMVQLIIGCFTLIAWKKLVERFHFFRPDPAIFFAIPFVIFYGILNLTPDLLFLTLVLVLLNQSLEPTPVAFWKTALVGALLYFTKAFGLPFFFAWIIAEKFISKRSRKDVLQKAVLFALMVSPWIVALSVHYRQPMISAVGRFNTSIDVSPLPERGAELPILRGGIIEPLAGTLSAWETPGEFVSSQRVTLVNDPQNYFRVVKRNLQTIWYYDFKRQLGIIFALLLIHTLFFNRSFFLRREVQLSLLIILLMYGGYSAILVHTRYVWICYWLMFLLTIAMVENIPSIGKELKYGIVCLFLIFVWKRPVKQILFNEDKDVTLFQLGMALRHPLTTMQIMYISDVVFEKELAAMKYTKLSGKLIAIKSADSDRNTYSRALRIAFDHRLTFYGTIDSEQKVPMESGYVVLTSDLQIVK